MKNEDNLLFLLIHDYLQIYLPKQRRASPNTVRSYRKALEELLDYIKESGNIPFNSITLERLTPETVFSFLEYLETERGCSLQTRNTRFAAIRAFMDYASDRDISLVATLNELRKIPFKKPADKDIIDYMSMEAVATIVGQAADSPKERRNRFFIMLMYDTGARVQEMLGIKLCDFQLGRTPKVTLHGKGGKTRVVPLLEKTVQHLQAYLKEFHIGIPLSAERPLFYSVTYGSIHPLSDRMIRYILQKYGIKAKEDCAEVPENVHPHLFRHSRAMHLYQEGMDLTLVSQWLGHSQLETTKIYAHADTEQKRRAIAASTPPDNPLYSKLNSARYTVTDEETLKRLAGLR